MLLPPLKVIWLASQQPSGKLLAAALPDWVRPTKRIILKTAVEDALRLRGGFESRRWV